jgi:mevalonate kinase
MRVTQLEFTRLAAEKIKLQTQIKEIIDAQNTIVKAYKKALEDLRITRSKEKQLRKQMDLVNRRAEDAIAVESREIEEIE